MEISKNLTKTMLVVRSLLLLLLLNIFLVLISGKKNHQRDEDEIKFMDWLIKNDVDVSNFEISRFRGERGLRASKSFEPREILLKIPHHLIISEDVAREGLANMSISMKHEKLYQRNGIEVHDLLAKVPSCDVVALFLASQRRLSSSKFEPYIKILPDKINIPLFMNLNDIASAARHSESIFRIVENQFRTFEKKADTYAEMYVDMFNVTFEEFHDDFRWAYGQLLSRAWRISEGDTSQCFMYPLIDMLNHKEHHGEPVALEHGNVGVMASSSKGVRQGQEMFQNYHITSRCNTESFWLYGFLNLENKEYECAFLDVDMVAFGEEEEKAKKRIALARHGITSSMESFIVRASFSKQDVLEMERLWSALRVLEASEEDLQSLEQQGDGVFDVASILSSRRSDDVLSRLRRVRRLDEAIRSRLDSMTQIDLQNGWQRKLKEPGVLVAILLQNERKALEAFESSLNTIWWDMIKYEFVPFALPLLF